MSIQKTFEDVLRDEPATIDDVLQTLRVLRDDFARNPDEWENPTLDRYLEAMQAWLGAVQDRVGTQPSWRLFILMLQAAKHYE